MNTGSVCEFDTRVIQSRDNVRHMVLRLVKKQLVRDGPRSEGATETKGALSLKYDVGVSF